MNDRDPWLERLDELEREIRRFIAEARSADRPEATDALADVLDGIRGELLEDVHASRHQVTGRAPRGFHPALRPAADAAEGLLRRVSCASAWNAAGLRLRLRST